MRVALVNTYECRGGAARAAHRLYRALRGEGIDASLMVAQRDSDDPRVVSLPALPARVLTAVDGLRRRKALIPYPRPRGLEPFQIDNPWLGGLLLRSLPRADVVNLHWVAGLLDFACLPELARRSPLVWTLHDMLAFTGGCHYDEECGRFAQGCGACPQLGSASPEDLSRASFERKRRLLAAIAPERLRFVAPSRWLAGELARSPLVSRFDVSVVPNSVDLGVFQPTHRAAARATLGLPAERFIVLFMAQDLDNRRKGMTLLEEAFGALGDMPRLMLVSAGAGEGPAKPRAARRHFGFVDDDLRLATLFGAVDAFVVPSLQDNLPNTMLESLACATPVIGHAVGGIPDLVRHGETGLLADPRSPGTLAAAIRALAGDPARARGMGARGRELVSAMCAPAAQAMAYRRLFEGMRN